MQTRLALTALALGLGLLAPVPSPAKPGSQVLYYAHPGELAALPGHLSRYPFSGAVVPLQTADLYGSGPLDEGALHAEAQAVRSEVKGELWFVVGSTNKSEYPTRHTFWPWTDSAQWQELTRRFDAFARAAESVNAGVMVDSEYYPADGSTSQKLGWVKGDRATVLGLGKAVGQACKRVPFANSALDYWESWKPSYRLFWQGALNGHSRPAMLACDGFYQNTDPRQLETRLRSRWHPRLRVIHGRMLRPTESTGALRTWRKQVRDGLLFSEDLRWLGGAGREQRAVRGLVE